ncbi:transcriptional regulator [Enterococcus avium]|nr:transcriptional regulator [Enterococcus avium]
MSFYFIALFLLGSFLLQTYLTTFQLKDFQKNYKQLMQNGRVVIGKNRGRFRAGTIVMFALNDSNEVTQAVQMQGLTFKSRFKDFSALNGIDFTEVSEDHENLLHYNTLTKKAIISAREAFLTNGEPQNIQKESLFNKIASKLRKNEKGGNENGTHC